MALRKTIRIDLRCPQHRRETGLNPRVSCIRCRSLRRILESSLELEGQIRYGSQVGLIGKQSQPVVSSTEVGVHGPATRA